MDRDAALLETRREEALALLQAERSTLERADRILGFGVSIVAIGTVAALANGFPEVLLGAPVALCFLLAYALQIFADLVAFGAGRRMLEMWISRQLEGEAMIAETRIAPLRDGHRNPSIRATQALYLVVLLTAVAAGAVISTWHGWLAVVAYSAVTCLALVVVALAAVEFIRARARAEQSMALKARVPAEDRGGSKQAARWRVPVDRPRVFISHTHRDQSAAAAIAQQIERAGYAPWLAEREIAPGTDARSAIQGIVRDADALVVLVGASPSDWTRYEWSEVLARGWSDPEVPIVPVTLGEERPSVFSGFGAVRVDPDTGVGTEELLRHLREPMRIESARSERQALRARLDEVERAALRIYGSD